MTPKVERVMIPQKSLFLLCTLSTDQKMAKIAVVVKIFGQKWVLFTKKIHDLS
jgi:hypothetical protein